MAVAYFQAHAPRGFWPIQNGGELAVLYCFIFLYFAAVGLREAEHRLDPQVAGVYFRNDLSLVPGANHVSTPRPG